MTHSAKPAPLRRGATASRRRRETASAQTPEGTSRTKPVTDQIANSDEISAVESPASAKSSA
jgi:hypothetical protein